MRSLFDIYDYLRSKFDNWAAQTPENIRLAKEGLKKSIDILTILIQAQAELKTDVHNNWVHKRLPDPAIASLQAHYEILTKKSNLTYEANLEILKVAPEILQFIWHYTIYEGDSTDSQKEITDALANFLARNENTLPTQLALNVSKRSQRPLFCEFFSFSDKSEANNTLQLLVLYSPNSPDDEIITNNTQLDRLTGQNPSQRNFTMQRNSKNIRHNFDNREFQLLQRIPLENQIAHVYFHFEEDFNNQQKDRQKQKSKTPEMIPQGILKPQPVR